jgi:hypothetical protein
VTPAIHFWLHDPPPADEYADWNPDRSPQQFASGVGHNMLELAKRLEGLGARVSVGSHVPANVGLVILYLWSSLRPAPALRGAMRAVQRARGRFAIIRGDTPSGWAFPLQPVREFMPTDASVEEEWQRWVPPLPQRGLVPRRSERLGRVRSLAFKGNPENVPPELASREWAQALGARGIRWWLDAPARTDGPDQSWHDFGEVDAVLCVRHPVYADDLGRKPATRLVNAWVAGCVPFAAREPGYVELGQDGRDVFFVDGPRECLELLDCLNRDPQRLGAVEAEVARKGVEYSHQKTARRWHHALMEAAAAAEELGTWSRTSRVLAIIEKRLEYAVHERTNSLRVRAHGLRGRFVHSRREVDVD